MDSRMPIGGPDTIALSCCYCEEPVCTVRRAGLMGMRAWRDWVIAAIDDAGGHWVIHGQIAHWYCSTECRDVAEVEGGLRDG